MVMEYLEGEDIDTRTERLGRGLALPDALALPDTLRWLASRRGLLPRGGTCAGGVGGAIIAPPPDQSSYNDVRQPAAPVPVRRS